MLKFVRQPADRVDEGRKSLEGERRMTIAGFRIQNILKTCRKGIRGDEEEPKREEGGTREPDSTKISFEGRRVLIRQRAAVDLIKRLTKASNMSASPPEESQ